MSDCVLAGRADGVHEPFHVHAGWRRTCDGHDSSGLTSGLTFETI